MVLITFLNTHTAAISGYTDVVGCNEQVFVQEVSWLELPYTYNPAERCPLNIGLSQKLVVLVSSSSVSIASIFHFLSF